MKKQITFEVAEKPVFENELDIKQTLTFLSKLEQTVKLYNKHSKALKEYMVSMNLVDLKAGEYNAHISTGTARRTLDNELLNSFLIAHDTNLENFKMLGNPPKSLEIYRD